MIINKLKAAGAHFLLSILLISLLMGLILYFWFPDALFQVSNFKEIALLIISIDLVLGPLLTFVVFKPHKKSLKFDLSTIAAIQITALAYGVFSIYQAHPVYIAFNVDRFTLVNAVDAKPKNATLEEFKISKLSSPKLVVAKLPQDEKERSNITMEILSGKPDIALRPELYHSYDENIHDILLKSLDPDVVFHNQDKLSKLNKFIKKHGKSKVDYAYLPLEGSSKDAIWALDKKTAKPIGIIPVSPWVQ